MQGFLQCVRPSEIAVMLVLKLSCLTFCLLIEFQGGFRVSSSSYKLFREARTWDQARQLCLDRGGYLAELTTRSEFNDVKRELGKSHNLSADC